MFDVFWTGDIISPKEVLDMLDPQVDVVIIGAGVIGLAVASQVAKEGREVLRTRKKRDIWTGNK